MNDILEEIVTRKRVDLTLQKEAVSLHQMRRLAESRMQQEADQRRQSGQSRLSMRQALAASPTGIISEFKRRSPSKGWIKQEADPTVIPPSYEAAGASALSILTDEPFFGGTLHDIQLARPLVGIPILRKDFVIDPYQVYQARAVGANAVLLIAACLQESEARELTALAHELELEVLLEVHSANELSYVQADTDMVGVNNRHLGTFHTDVENSFQLAGLLPKDKLLVSESGISNPQTVHRLREAGFRGFLIGECFMKTANPGHSLETFIHQLKSIDLL
jgi:indole-3-glycerol phosphate synthase